MSNKSSIIMTIIGIIVCVLIIAGCVFLTIKNSTTSGKFSYNNDNVEWISPDGVHYWKFTTLYGISFTPRYDNNGQLVIDKR